MEEKRKRGRPKKQPETQAEAIEAAKKTWVRNPQKNFGEENVQPGDNSRYLRYAMASLNLPPIDISDEKQVQNRIMQYFDYCIENDRKPNIVGMANWLGVDRTTLNSWKRGEYRSKTHSPLIEKVVLIMEELWVDYMQNGKVNPASGIFLGKNMFGYKDQQDLVVAPAQPLGPEPDASQLLRDYAEYLPSSDYEQEPDGE